MSAARGTIVGLSWAIVMTAAAGQPAAPPARATFHYVEGPSHEAHVRIDCDDVSDYAVAPALFGKFTESIANSVYGGVWAQLLQNPSLESIQTCRAQSRYAWEDTQRVGDLTHRDLARNTDLARVAYQWFAWNVTDDHLQLNERAFNTKHCQRVRVDALPDGAIGGGICQPLYMPLERCTEYRLSFYVRRDVDVADAAPMIAAVVDARRPDIVLGRKVITWPRGDGWHRLACTLTLDEVAENVRRPVMFCLGLTGKGAACFDQVMLFPSDAIEGFDPVVIALCRDSHVSLLRFPGGNYVSGYHWKDDLVPLDKRPTMPNPAWPEMDPHHVGTDEHITLCRLIGAEPLICVNAGDGTPQEAADWVEYCNGGPETKWGQVRASRGHVEPFGVKRWEIGNELWGDWQIGHCTPEVYAQRYRAFYDAMKAVDPGIEVIACGNKGDFSPRWNEVLLSECSDIVDSLTVHLLFFNSNNSSPEFSYVNQIGYSHAVENMFRRIHADGRRHGIDLNIAITECFQATTRAYHTRPHESSEVVYYGGIFTASVRTQGIVNVHAHTALVNLAGGIERRFGRVYAEPVFHARDKLRTLVGARPVSCEVRTAFETIPDWQSSWAGDESHQYPVVDALPLRRDAQLSVVLLSRAPRDQIRAQFELRDRTIDGDHAMVWQLAGDTWYDANSAVQPTRVQPDARCLSLSDNTRFSFDLPPASLTVVELPLTDAARGGD